MSNIRVTVNEQNLHIVDSPKIAAQGVNENYVVFDFDPTWNGFGKSVLFYREDDEKTVYESVIDGNTNTALVPHEVTAQDGKICFGVAGVKDDIVYTSEIVKYRIVKGIYTAGEESNPPTPGIYEQMLALAEALRVEVNSFEEQVNDELENTPYTYFVEDGTYELPVHTIKDSERSSASTWSSQKIVDMIYPVGAIFMSVSNVNPSTYLGGTWVAWAAGRVPLGVGTYSDSTGSITASESEMTGGEINHQLTASEMPTHRHYNSNTNVIGYTSGTPQSYQVGAGTTGHYAPVMGSSAWQAIAEGTAGGNQYHNNLQPFISCYMWKRTA